MFIFAKVYFLLTASYACSTGFESTYEELKPLQIVLIWSTLSSFESTYEELKPRRQKGRIQRAALF